MEVEKKTVDLEKLDSLFSNKTPFPWVVCRRQGGIYISTESGCRDMTDKDVELFIYLLDFTPAIISELKEIIKLRKGCRRAPNLFGTTRTDVANSNRE